MPDYRKVKKPSLLKPTPMSLADVQLMENADTANVGVAVGARQLNCKYRDGMTYVVPVDSAVEPFKFAGYIDPADVRAWFEAMAARQAAPAPAED